VKVIKHGRQGHPKERYLYCDSILSKLYWRPDANHPEQEDLTQSVEAVLKQEQAMRRDKRRLSFLGKKEVDREILFKDILEVRDDIQTDIMVRAYENSAFKDISHNMRLISVLILYMIIVLILLHAFTPFFTLKDNLNRKNSRPGNM
jgi:hypothetical protein